MTVPDTGPDGHEPRMVRQAADSAQPLPSFSEQVASQLGGVRGMVETGIPIIAFVIVNVIWSLRPALIASVAVGLAIGAFRLYRKQSVRHAVNGLFGIALGAFIAYRTGEATDF